MSPFFFPTAAGSSCGLWGLNWVCLALALAGLVAMFWGLWKAVTLTAARSSAAPSPSAREPEQEEPLPGRAALLSEYLRK